MIEQYLEVYPQGVPLSANQLVFNLSDGALPVVQWLVAVPAALASTLSLSVLRQRLSGCINLHLALSCRYPQPSSASQLNTGTSRALLAKPLGYSVAELDWPLTQPLDLAQLAAAQLIAIHPAEGINLQLILIRQGSNSYLALRGCALATDTASLALLASVLVAESIPVAEVLQYPDYVGWLAENASEPAGLAGQAYWQQYLQSQPATLRLPYHLSPTDDAIQTMAHQAWQLPAPCLQAVSSLAEQLSLSRAQLLEACWFWLLARLSPQQQYLAALHYDPRHCSDVFDGAVGCYEKKLPLVVRYAPDTSLWSWLQDFAQTSAAHYQHAESISARQLSGGSVEQIAEQVSCQSLARLPHDLQLAKPLSLMLCFDQTGGLQLHYVRQHYSAAAIGSLLEQFEQALHGFSRSDATTTSASISLLSAPEQQRHLQLAAMPPSQVNNPTLLEQLALFAKDAGTALALYDKRAYSYAQLFQLVQQCAAGIVQLRPQATGPVALWLERSAENIILMLACQYLGRGYAPIDPGWPSARVQQVLAQLDEPLLIVANANDNASASCDYRQVLAAGQQQLVPQMAVDGIAYVIFTSGSTGQPKGVVIGQQQLANYCAAAAQGLALHQQQRFALTATVAADLGYTCLYGALYLGKQLYIADYAQCTERQAFAEFLQLHQIDCLKIVPSHLQALCDGQNLPYWPAKIIVGGEACSPALAKAIELWSPRTALYNHYGPSETTIGVMYHHYQPGADKLARLSRAFNGCAVYILNDAFEMCSTGELGQLYIAGAQLANGYLRPPQNSPFIKHPQWQQRLYATGDLARYMPDGSIVLAGRNDDQVKIHGFRVETAEIGQHIEKLAIAGVEQCLVLPVAGTAQLSAFLLAPTLPQGLLSGAQRQHIEQQLSQVLPAVMLPAHYHVLHRWPRLANGKVDRLKLAELQRLEQQYSAPAAGLESELARFYQQVLGIGKICRHRSFFQAGGHSISAIKLLKRWTDSMPVAFHFDLATLYQQPSVAALASAIQKSGASGLDQGGVHALNQIQAQQASLICIHDGLGLTLSYQALAGHFNGRLNCYGLLPGSLDLAQSADFNELALAYARHIATAITKGDIPLNQQPLWLLGWSMGGLLATLVAGYLNALGVAAVRLLLVDSWLPPQTPQATAALALNTDLAMFLQDLPAQHAANWCQQVETLCRSCPDSPEESSLWLLFERFWQQQAVNLAQPLCWISAEQVWQTFLRSRQLQQLRQAGFHWTTTTGNVHVDMVWGLGRDSAECQAFSDRLRSAGMTTQSCTLALSHQQIIVSDQLFSQLEPLIR